MIYSDDPTIKELVRRIEYLERKVKEINIRTLPITPIAPIGPVEPTPEQAEERRKEIQVIVDAAAEKLRVAEDTKGVVIVSDENECLGCS